MRIPCGVTSSSPLPPIGSRSPSPIVFSMFFLLWIVLHVLSLIFTTTGCFFHQSPIPPWSIYSVHSPPLGMIVCFFLYSCYSVTSIRTLCIQPPAEIGFICLIHSPLYPVVLNVLKSLNPSLPYSFSHARTTSPPDRFGSHHFRCHPPSLSLSLFLSLSSPLSSFGFPLLLSPVFI